MFKITYNIITITRSDITMIRRHYLFYGRVQEVGFSALQHIILLKS